ncbi:hypothetical protein MBLNU230_g1951t1 [Neophaeotheca triangularis]
MFGRIATALALAASTVHAIALHQSVRNSYVDHLPTESHDTRHTSIVVPCPSCDPPASWERQVTKTAGDGRDLIPSLATGEQGLQLDVWVSEDGKAVTLNGLEIFPEYNMGLTKLQQVSKLSTDSFSKSSVNLTGSSSHGWERQSPPEEEGKRFITKTITLENVNMIELLRGVTVSIQLEQAAVPDGQVRIAHVTPLERSGHKRPLPNTRLTGPDERDFGPAPPEDAACSALADAEEQERMFCLLTSEYEGLAGARAEVYDVEQVARNRAVLRAVAAVVPPMVMAVALTVVAFSIGLVGGIVYGALWPARRERENGGGEDLPRDIKSERGDEKSAPWLTPGYEDSPLGYRQEKEGWKGRLCCSES